MAKTSTFLLCLLASSISVLALPANTYPELIPGPGLPSLESLGITSRDLYSDGARITKRAPNPLEARFDLICTDNGGGRIPIAHARACVKYLLNLGTTPCGVSGTNTVFCTTQVGTISGSNLQPGGPPAQSFCSDVAAGAQAVVDQCTDASGNVAGAAAANGNGNLIVSIEHA